MYYINYFYVDAAFFVELNLNVIVCCLCLFVFVVVMDFFVCLLCGKLKMMNMMCVNLIFDVLVIDFDDDLDDEDY